MKPAADSCRTISCNSYGIDPIRCDWYTRPKSRDDYHSHLDFYELVVVLEGSCRDVWEGKELKLVPGIFFVYAPGSRHIYTHLRNFRYMQVLFSSGMMQVPEPLSLSEVPGFSRLIPQQGSRSENFLLGESDMAKVHDDQHADCLSFSQQRLEGRNLFLSSAASFLADASPDPRR